tara:strand:- start:180 stop:353 length:174 start_codon:yes stop_codon:yes gene_type:complete
MKSFIKKELKELTNNENYWGSEKQIKNEIYILNKTKIEMENRESIEEWLKRILKITS